MGYALALTMIGAGAVLIYSGFHDKGVWNIILQTIRGSQPVVQPLPGTGGNQHLPPA